MPEQRLNPALLRIARKGDLVKIIIAMIFCIAALFVQKVLDWRLADQYIRLSLQPIISIPDTAVRWYNKVAEISIFNQDYISENALLKEQNLILSARLNNLINTESENVELRRLLGVKSSLTQFEGKVAQVAFIAHNPLQQIVSINLGVEDGMKIGQAVIDGDGVVGQIVQVGLLHSQIMLISDPSVTLPVYNARNGLRSFIKGNGRDLMLQSPEQSYLFNQQDVLLTSGYGGTFPKGYPVGTIKNVLRDRYLIQVDIEPFANLASLSRVLVLVNEANRPIVGPPNPNFE